MEKHKINILIFFIKKEPEEDKNKKRVENISVSFILFHV